MCGWRGARDPMPSTALTAQRACPTQLLGPTQRAGLHPLLVPLSFNATKKRVTALLRWPRTDTGAGPAMPLPLVSSSLDGLDVALLAPSVDKHLVRVAVGLEARNDARAADVLAVVNEEGEMYQRGAAAASKLAPAAYLTLKVRGASSGRCCVEPRPDAAAGARRWDRSPTCTST